MNVHPLYIDFDTLVTYRSHPPRQHPTSSYHPMHKQHYLTYRLSSSSATKLAGRYISA